MGETNKAQKAPKARKTSWFSGLKAEFKKISWTDRKSLTKETVAVISTSIVLALIIKVLDMIMTFGIDFLVTL